MQAIDELPNGDLLVAGSTNLGGVARRSGTTWSAVGSNPPAQTADVLGLPSGEILAIAADSVQRFDGVQWSHGPERTARKIAAVARHDLLDAGDRQRGTDFELRIPDAPFLIGLVLHAQVAPLDLGLSGVTSTNALQLVIGDR